MKLWKTATTAIALAAGSLALAAPAEAHGDRAGIAIGAGIVGLAIGAAIASDHNDSDVYVRYDNRPRYYGGYYQAYPAYPVYRPYPAYRSYPAWRGYDPRYDEGRRWREHERWEDHERWEHRGGWRGW
ncbi:hypothetical protein AQZ52_15595 [Novosphingobium fuchskuhlense]|uniref:Uncharacterized protein n=1 Tax=Novosphingobium fuchskuhlense TaxID=1117702 RepID=A0A117USX3_9SPHN|nr:hypothetical protein [Novosphingobium fuchskuhlense]KUR70276.1 hypothetical protein AQZ52_15595 [Novosphingobium fuchskuhlense]